MTFNPLLQELVDIITEGLSRAGYTNLLRFVGSGDSLEDAILGLKPFGVVSLAPLTDAQRERVSARGVQLVIQPQAIQISIDKAIGRLQARHLASMGYESVAAVLPIAHANRSSPIRANPGFGTFRADRLGGVQRRDRFGSRQRGPVPRAFGAG